MVALKTCQERAWRHGGALDSQSRGPGFDPQKGHSVVSLCKTY